VFFALSVTAVFASPQAVANSPPVSESGLIAGLVAGIIVLALIIVIITVILFLRSRRHRQESTEQMPPENLSGMCV
jgi:hypothetical protein